MGVAYEQACIDLDAGKFAVRELVAKRIIEAALLGERNPATLASYGKGLTAARPTSHIG
jgi:hypothetical protein